MKLADDGLLHKLKNIQKCKLSNATSFELENLQYSWINNEIPPLNVTIWVFVLGALNSC